MTEFSFKKNCVPHDASDSIVQAQELVWEGPLADWARIQSQELGETVKPFHLFVAEKKGRPHQVAWIRRQGMDFSTGTTYDFYHAACDCIPEAEYREDMEIMLACNGLQTALVRRAQEVEQQYKVKELLEVYPATDSEGLKLGSAGKQLIISTMLYLLERDYKHPEDWVANYVNGRHELPLLSVITGRETEELSEYAAMLEAGGLVQLENQTIKLTEATDN